MVSLVLIPFSASLLIYPKLLKLLYQFHAGLLTAIRTDRLKVLSYRELSFYDCGDRVAQFFHLRTKSPFHKRYNDQDLLLVNTHLLFPHDSSFCRIRLRQVCSCVRIRCYCLFKFVDHICRKPGLTLLWTGSQDYGVFRSFWDGEWSICCSCHSLWVSHISSLNVLVFRCPLLTIPFVYM